MDNCKRSNEKNEDEGNVGSIISVPEDSIKHPLENSWSIWLYTNKSKNWNKNLVELTSFDTVEDFWCLYHHMKSPSELAAGMDYAIFKQGIQPMWEDKANEKGGRWLIPLSKTHMNSHWLDTVLLMIGENFENNKEITGAVVNVRAKSKLGIWTAKSKNWKENEEIGRKVKSVLGLEFDIGYQKHDKAANLYVI